MSTVMYAGQRISVSDSLDMEELAGVILDSCAKGLYSWITVESPGPSQSVLRLLVGPGIPVGLITGD